MTDQQVSLFVKATPPLPSEIRWTFPLVNMSGHSLPSISMSPTSWSGALVYWAADLLNSNPVSVSLLRGHVQLLDYSTVTTNSRQVMIQDLGLRDGDVLTVVIQPVWHLFAEGLGLSRPIDVECSPGLQFSFFRIQVAREMGIVQPAVLVFRNTQSLMLLDTDADDTRIGDILDDRSTLQITVHVDLMVQ